MLLAFPGNKRWPEEDIVPSDGLSSIFAVGSIGITICFNSQEVLGRIKKTKRRTTFKISKHIESCIPVDTVRLSHKLTKLLN